MARAEAGNETTLTRNGRPVARIVPVLARTARRTPGAMRGRIRVPDCVEGWTAQDDADRYGT